jgi:cytoskeleton protein RodZ
MSNAGETPGSRLKGERERRGLSAQKAADDMHLDAWVIDALESDDYQRVGPPVYAKGHLKKYASMLGLPAEEIMAGYAALSAAPAAPPPPPNVRLRASIPDVHDLPWLKVAGSILAALLLAGVIWWRPWHHHGAIPGAGVSSIPSGGTSRSEDRGPEAVSSPLDAQAAPAQAGASPLPRAGTVIPAVLDTAAAEPGAAGSGRATLRMSFSADSWVDVRDAAGQRVFAGFGHANSVKSIAGNAPMRVYLGFAGGVQLEINERAVAITPQFVTGNVARFEAGADGVLRRDSRAARPRG